MHTGSSHVGQGAENAGGAGFLMSPRCTTHPRWSSLCPAAAGSLGFGARLCPEANAGCGCATEEEL